MHQKRNEEKKRNRLWLDLLFIGIAIGIATLFRIILSYDTVIIGDTVMFRGVDSYYHMRLIDQIVANFPNVPLYDYFVSYPFGTEIAIPLFFNQVIATAIMLFKGNPDIVSAYVPAVMGILTLIPVYIIAKVIFKNHWIAGITVLILATLPGEFMGRTMLGSTDQHAIEILLSTTVAMFAVLAFASTDFKKWIYASLSGGFLTLYYLSWTGSILFMFLITLYVYIQLIIEAKRDNLKQGLNRLLVAITICSVSYILFMATTPHINFVFPVTIIMFGLAITYPLFRFIKHSPWLPLGTISALAILIMGALWLYNPRYIDVIAGSASQLSSMLIWHVTSFTSEEMPLLMTLGKFTLHIAWSYFGITFYLSLVGFGFLLYRVVKGKTSNDLFLLVWFVLLLANTLAMRRFSYYFAIPLSLTTAYFVWYFVSVESAKIFKKRINHNLKLAAAYGLVITVLILLPNIRISMVIAKSQGTGMTPGWAEAMNWLENETEDVEGYYDTGKGEVPEWGVLSWWDYGYWIAREGKRPAVCDPGGGDRNMAACVFIGSTKHVDQAFMDVYFGEELIKFLGLKLGEDLPINAINQLLDSRNVKYIIIDNQMVNRKYYSMAMHGYSKQSKYQENYELVYDQRLGKSTPVNLYYEDYYNSVAVRLYIFNGEQIVAPGTPVFTVKNKENYKEIVEVHDFPNIQEAEAFIIEQTNGITNISLNKSKLHLLSQEGDSLTPDEIVDELNSLDYVIAGTSPFLSPFTMPALTNFELVFQSNSAVQTDIPDGKGNMLLIPEVKIFKYRR